MKNLIITSLVLFQLSSCINQGGKKGKNTNINPEDVKVPNIIFEHDAIGDFEGVNCFSLKDSGNSKSVIKVRLREFIGNFPDESNITFQFFSGDTIGCQDEHLLFNLTATFFLYKTKDSIVEQHQNNDYGENVDLKIKAIELTPMSDFAAIYLTNNEECETAEWQNGIPQDITNKHCGDSLGGGLKMPEVGSTLYYFIAYKVNNQNMGNKFTIQIPACELWYSPSFCQGDPNYRPTKANLWFSVFPKK